MKILLRLIAVAALAALGTWFWMLLHPGPEQIIRKRLLDVAHCASYTAQDGNFKRVANAQKLTDIFAADAQVVVDFPGVEQFTLQGRDEIFQAAARARSVKRSVKVEFLDLHVTLGSDRKTAQVELTAKVFLPDEKDFIPAELKFSLKQFDGDWLITRGESVKVLK